MTVFTYISNAIMPVIIFLIILYGIIKKVDVYEEFISGAAEGMKIVAGLVPTLLGLFLAVHILNESGALQIITTILKPVAYILHTPNCIVPVVITKLFSSGSATALMLNIFANYGPDSLEGITASLILSSTESLFYTMSVFLMAAGVKKSGYIIPCSLIAIMTAVAVSICLAHLII
jgi:spore maturation protein B